MKKIIWLCVVFFIAFQIKAQDKVVVNDPNAQLRQVSSFNEISVSGGIDLYLSPDEKETVVVSANDNRYRDRIITRVVDNRLEIYYENKGNIRWPDNMKLKAYVSFKTLQKLKASGSSDVYVNGVIKSEKLEIRLSGSSDFKGAIKVNEFVLNQSGSSDSRISGTADRVTIDVSGSSDVKAYEMAVNYCDVEASGASDIQITVNKELSARASGASDINYMGSGIIKEIKSSGSSSVSKKG